jgi:AMIN domain
MGDLDQSDYPEDSQNRKQTVKVRIPLIGLAVVLSLLVGAMAGIVAYRYAASHGKARIAVPAPSAAPPPPAAAAASNQPAVRRVDSQFMKGNAQVTLTLEQPVPYDAHRLDHPDRVYIDLHSARLPAELAGQTLFVNKGGVSDIRLAQTQPDTVRVVLDLEKRFDYSVTQQTNPPALVVKLTPHVRARRRGHHPKSGPKKSSPQ